MPNRLAQETSPYLLQHRDNPVDWYPWGEEAMERARREEKPVFLSIGYAACHWCHVMEHESFENAEIAALLNERFVPVKVDREERPDLDHIYMSAVQLLTGHGGWPMSVFLTPAMEPFYGGTYWPPEPSRGMPGFRQVLEAVDEAWQKRRESATGQAGELTRHIASVDSRLETDAALSPELLRGAVVKYERAFDPHHGGFGGAPKFPHAMDLQFLLRRSKRDRRKETLAMVTLTLDRMARGGIYDHLGGGFARYSVDERWLVPHFEKMLYDNALLAGTYLDAFLVTRNPQDARIARETCDYVLREMTDEGGGFHSSEDADSEGEEGKFYVWTPAEVKEVLGDELGERFCLVYDVTEEGNFEGRSILNLPKTLDQTATLHGWEADELARQMDRARAALREARSRRVPPGRDDKVIVNWNALMIDALARAAAPLDEPRYLKAARRAADFLLGAMRRDDGRLLHTWRQGRARFDAYLDDYACLANALVSLHQATFEERWIDRAVELLDVVLARFADPDGGFYFTADDHEPLITRPRDLQDGSVPSGNSMAATALVRLGRLTGRDDYLAAAEGTLALAVGLMERAPQAAGQMLIAADHFLSPGSEVAIVGDPSQPAVAESIEALRLRFLPDVLAAGRSDPQSGSPHLAPLFAGKPPADDPPAVYICRQFACQQPVHGPDAALAAWDRLAEGE